MYSRLTGYRKGTQEESYTYDAEGVRRSRTAGSAENSTVYFVSDTSGSLSRTLAETDGRGTVRAEYTADGTLTAQTRNGEVSWYLYDGHGDVRGLLDAEGRVTDTYRYSAYGELLAKTGDTENHYLYTGEYYDGTSGLYYLRARYMNPSTGTFLTMDTYEGSIYEPATLHKYLYANGNPVTYSDPGGHAATSLSELSVTGGISSVLQNRISIYWMGLISGTMNSAVTAVAGGGPEECGAAFLNGFLTGCILGTVQYFAVGMQLVTMAEFLVAGLATNTIMNIVMMTAAVISGDSRSVLIYGTLSVLSFITFCQAYNVNGSVTVTGNKGTARIAIEGAGAEDVAVSKSGADVLPNAENLKMSKTVQNHLNEIIKKGPNAGQYSRPYVDSYGTTLLLKEIMESATPAPDKFLQSGLRWDVQGTFRGTMGTWELVIDLSTDTVVHFNFVAQ